VKSEEEYTLDVKGRGCQDMYWFILCRTQPRAWVLWQR